MSYLSRTCRPLSCIIHVHWGVQYSDWASAIGARFSQNVAGNLPDSDVPEGSAFEQWGVLTMDDARRPCRICCRHCRRFPVIIWRTYYWTQRVSMLHIYTVHSEMTSYSILGCKRWHVGSICKLLVQNLLLPELRSYLQTLLSVSKRKTCVDWSEWLCKLWHWNTHKKYLPRESKFLLHLFVYFYTRLALTADYQ